VLATPTSPLPAFKIGERTADPLQMYLADIYTVAPALAGVPALSQCCGFTKSGLPIGLQLISAPLAEETVFRVGGAYERATAWHTRRPQHLEALS
jgi:aspartyl-tRNA(Asn)/glutamyl-tRNA(Gln) amidotransferase subunit A